MKNKLAVYILGLLFSTISAQAYVWEADYDSGCLNGPCNCSWVKLNGVTNIKYGGHLVHNGDQISAKWSGSGCPDQWQNMGTITIDDGTTFNHVTVLLPPNYTIGVWDIVFNPTTGSFGLYFNPSLSTSCP